MMAELALILSRVEWKPVKGAISIAECSTAMTSILDEIRPQPSRDPALDRYVDAAFKEAGR